MPWLLSWLECPPPHVSRARGIVKVRVRIPAILNFFKLSFRNCISRAFYCDDPNISFISSLRGSKIWDSYFHHFMFFLYLPFVAFLFVELERRLWVMERLQRNVWGATGQKELILEGKVTTLSFIPLPLPLPLPLYHPPQKGSNAIE